MSQIWAWVLPVLTKTFLVTEKKTIYEWIRSRDTTKYICFAKYERMKRIMYVRKEDEWIARCLYHTAKWTILLTIYLVLTSIRPPIPIYSSDRSQNSGKYIPLHAQSWMIVKIVKVDLTLTKIISLASMRFFNLYSFSISLQNSGKYSIYALARASMNECPGACITGKVNLALTI